MTLSRRTNQVTFACNATQTAPNEAQTAQNLGAFPAENEGFEPQSDLPVLSAVVEPNAQSPGFPERSLTAARALMQSGALQNLIEASAGAVVTTGNRGGRPRAIDAAAKQKICLLLQLGYSRSLAAAELGIARSTFTRTVRRDEVFRGQVRAAEELFERSPLLTIFEAAQRDWRAAAWLLKNHRPHMSVTRRKRREQVRESGRESKQWFQETCAAMESPKAESAVPAVRKRPAAKRRSGRRSPVR